MKIVQVRGCNGSGKTTIVRGLLSLDHPKNVSHLYWPNPKNPKLKPRTFATVAEGIGWAAIGSYPDGSKMGGCDGMKTMDDIKEAIIATYEQCPNLFGIVFEGMMISKSKWTFYDYLLGLKQEHPDIEPLFVILATSVKGCLGRIHDRGTHRAGVGAVNVDMIREKCEVTIKYAHEFDKQYVRWINVEKTPKTQMLSKFLHKVGDIDLWEQLTLTSASSQEHTTV